MTNRIRVALTCLLLVALPLQGFAAATMLNCGPNHHLQAAAVAALHEHHGQAGDHHHGHAMADAARPADHAGHDLGQLAKYKCSACAACCVGAALPSAAIAFASAAAPVSPTFFVPGSRVGFFTDGPERPPRATSL